MSDPKKPNATDDNSGASTLVDIDIDSLEIQILIICKNPAAFQQSASFLSRRGWPTTVIGNLSKAIDDIVKTSPDFVMISCNHPNQNIVRLPALIAQATKSQCIGFGELGDTATTARLNSLNVRHKLQGLPSGPNIQRFIRRILLDTYFPEANPKESQDQITANKAGAIVVKGPGAPKGQNSGAQSDGDEMLEAGAYKLGRRKRRKLKDVLASESQAAENKAQQESVLRQLADEVVNARGESGMLILPTKSEDDSTRGKPETFVATAPQGRQSDFQLNQEGPGKGREFEVRQEVAGSALLSAKSETPKGTAFSLKQTSPEGKAFSLLQPSPEGKTFSLIQPSPQMTERVSQLQNAMTVALQQCRGGGEELTNPVIIGQQLWVLPVDADNLHGYIVVNLSDSHAEDHRAYVERIKISLAPLLIAEGIKANLGDIFLVHTEPFEFWPWAESLGAWKLNSHIGNCEVGVCFVPTTDNLPKARETNQPDIAAISVAHVEIDRPVSFKAYLHFQSAGRYYLYLRNGRQLLQKQKERLMNHKVEEFYIKTIDMNNFKVYVATTFIANTTKKFRPNRAG